MPSLVSEVGKRGKGGKGFVQSTFYFCCAPLQKKGGGEEGRKKKGQQTVRDSLLLPSLRKAQKKGKEREKGRGG